MTNLKKNKIGKIAAIVALLVAAGGGALMLGDKLDVLNGDVDVVHSIDRSPMSTGEYRVFILSANKAAESGQLKFKNINGEYTLVDAIREKVNY